MDEPKRPLSVDEIVCEADLKLFNYHRVMECGDVDIYGCNKHRVALERMPEYKGIYKVNRTYNVHLLETKSDDVGRFREYM